MRSTTGLALILRANDRDCLWLRLPYPHTREPVAAPGRPNGLLLSTRRVMGDGHIEWSGRPSLNLSLSVSVSVDSIRTDGLGREAPSAGRRLGCAGDDGCCSARSAGRGGALEGCLLGRLRRRVRASCAICLPRQLARRSAKERAERKRAGGAAPVDRIVRKCQVRCLRAFGPHLAPAWRPSQLSGVERRGGGMLGNKSHSGREPAAQCATTVRSAKCMRSCLASGAHLVEKRPLVTTSTTSAP